MFSSHHIIFFLSYRNHIIIYQITYIYIYVFIYRYLHVAILVVFRKICNILLKGINIFKKVKCILTFLTICVYIIIMKNVTCYFRLKHSHLHYKYQIQVIVLELFSVQILIFFVYVYSSPDIEFILQFYNVNMILWKMFCFRENISETPMLRQPEK